MALTPDELVQITQWHEWYCQRETPLTPEEHSAVLACAPEWRRLVVLHQAADARSALHVAQCQATLDWLDAQCVPPEVPPEVPPDASPAELVREHGGRFAPHPQQRRGH